MQQTAAFLCSSHLPTEAPSVHGRRSRFRRLNRLPQSEALVAELVFSGVATLQGADKLSSPLPEFSGERSSWGIPWTWWSIALRSTNPALETPQVLCIKTLVEGSRSTFSECHFPVSYK